MIVKLPNNILIKSGLNYYQASKAKKEFESRFPELCFYMSGERNKIELRFRVPLIEGRDREVKLC